ncbi:MAG TPA: pitrilysin family protein [Candidatus Babeliales bacterium]|nr:pitrilysin family protein [Candidatus Babeliales bacterium]
MNTPVIKHTLDNGLTLLILPINTIPKVSTQLWIAAGSADEKTGQRGIAHLLEHLLFKGTQRLSETDITHLVDKLSGYCNAMTSHDYTVYLFDFPRQHWTTGFDLLADIFNNARFEPDLLNSELFAVLQELKLYKDDYITTLEEEIIGMLFAGHPYHHPIIGYSSDLWQMTCANIARFYKTHYVPNNATLVVVGDVQPDEVIEQAEKHFGPLASKTIEITHRYLPAKDTVQQSITLYRDIDQSSGIICFTIPGLREKKSYYLDLLLWVIGKGKCSRLYKKIVDEHQWAADLDTYIYDTFDRSVLFISYEPIDNTLIPKIEKTIIAELQLIYQIGLTDNEVERAVRQLHKEHTLSMQEITILAEKIGLSYLATGDEQFIFTSIAETDLARIKKEIEIIVKTHCRPIFANSGLLMPFAKGDLKQWEKEQHKTDTFDSKMHAKRLRTSMLEEPNYSHTITAQPAIPFTFPRCHQTQLANGLDVLWYEKSDTPIISIVLDLAADYFFDPSTKQGLYNFLSRMLIEGTRNYNQEQLAYAFEHAGADMHIEAGRITIQTVPSSLKTILKLLNEILTASTFLAENVEKVRTQILTEIKQYWDDPSEYIWQYTHEHIYKNHPYAKNELGTIKSVQSITRDDLIDFYTRYISPQGAALCIVGDIKEYDIPSLLEESLGTWHGPMITPLSFPAIQQLQKNEYLYPLNRDQIVLGFAGASVSRTDQRYDALALFDHVLTGGVQGSMGSKLFSLREQSGLFYTIGGSLIQDADEQPGMIFIKTNVSIPVLSQAEQLIESTLDHAIDSFTDNDLIRAKNALINGLIDYASSTQSLALSFLLLRRYKLGADYFDKQPEHLSTISLSEVIDAVRSILSTDKLIKIKIGKV